MIGLERVAKIVRCAYASEMLEGQHPISVILIAPSDGGKSQILLNERPEWVRILNDFTYAPLISILEERWDNGKGTKHTSILVPDLNTVISHKPAVAQLTASILLSLLGEGLTEVPGIDGVERWKVDKLKNLGLTGSLMTGITPEMFRTKRGKWRETGLLRRMLPVNYDYRAATVADISLSIAAGQDKVSYAPSYYKYPQKKVIVRIESEHAPVINHLADMTLNQLSWGFTDKVGTKRATQGQKLPFSLHKTFRVYARAHALLHGRDTTHTDDIMALKDLCCFVRYDRPEEV